MKSKLLLVFTCFTFFCFAQENLVLKKSIKTAVHTSFCVDLFENIYIASKNESLLKITPQGDSLKNSYFSLASISSIDQYNNTIFYVFSKEQQLIQQYDRFLSYKSSIDLSETNSTFVGLISAGNNEQIWMYDEAQISLHKIFIPTLQSNLDLNISNIISDSSELTSLKEVHQNLFLLSKHKGIYLFDINGGFKNYIVLDGIIQFSATSKNLFYLSEQHELFKVNLNTFESNQILIPEKYQQIQVNPKNIYLSNGEKIDIYTLE